MKCLKEIFFLLWSGYDSSYCDHGFILEAKRVVSKTCLYTKDKVCWTPMIDGFPRTKNSWGVGIV